MHRGYIKIYRKISDSGLLQIHGSLAMFIYMLIEAAHKPTRFGTVDLKRGQLCSGRIKLAEALGLSEQKVRTCIDHLVKLEMIIAEPTNKYTLYTIVNYNNYQDNQPTDNQQITNNQPTDNQQITNNQPTDNQQITTIQEAKHLRIKEETKPARKRSDACTIQTFLDRCKESGEERIPKDDPVFDFAEKTNIQIEMVRVCWQNFVRKNRESGKRQADWRATFRNCVRDNWYKFWFIEADGSVKETSQYRAMKTDLGDSNVQ